MEKRNSHDPVRTCISCGKKRKKKELIRLYLDKDGRVLIDISGKNTGRGAYICDSRSCREKLHNNRGLNKRFRTDKRISVGSDLKE